MSPPTGSSFDRFAARSARTPVLRCAVDRAGEERSKGRTERRKARDIAGSDTGAESQLSYIFYFLQ